MITPVTGSAALSMQSGIASAATPGASGDFGKVLQGAISSIDGLRQDANTAIQKFLTGQNEEIHSTVMATQKAEMAFDLGLQVRNKVVSAYQEIMRMQI